jgi:hypothetical protein
LLLAFQKLANGIGSFSCVDFIHSHLDWRGFIALKTSTLSGIFQRGILSLNLELFNMLNVQNANSSEPYTLRIHSMMQ